ncbi:hypothetical protein KEC37_00640 [Candidatus Schneideria nysicola]|uniref:Trm112 family protein n=1 Tax=Candidatus Schneideria nysicola TaxID=1081631 RepID=UPI001CAA7E8F|nr:Trm112 family protein [Candidatus Schneideria nysicola]UAJ65651.1 hypothetical protein KEC37_00640 [Candidatus Schneideria nysicola]
MNTLLEIIVCPICQGELYLHNKQELICKSEKLAYPIYDGVPILLEKVLRVFTEEEIKI